jgi:hypothetical protein
MSLFYKLGEEADFEFIFLDATTHQPIDVNSPMYDIVYFVANVEQIVVPSTPLVHIETGKYTASWTVPLTTVPDTYFVRATGIHPVSLTSTVIEESFKIVTEDYFSQTSSGSGLTIKFTKD